MFHTIRGCAVLFLLTVPLQGQPVVHRHVTGLGVRLPVEWTAQDDTEAVLLLPPGVRVDANMTEASEVYVAVTQTGYTAAEEGQFVEQMSAGFLRRGGQMLRSGESETFTAGVRPASLYTWETMDPATGKRFALRMYLTAAGSRAFAIIAMGLSAAVNSRDSELRSMLSGMDFAAPEIAAGGPLADATPPAQQWLAKLRGKTIKQFIGGGGAAGQKTLFLGADGKYARRGSLAIAADVPGVSATSTGRDASAGHWHIAERDGRVYLQLVGDGGEIQLLSLTSDARNWYLNGEKAFAVDE